MNPFTMGPQLITDLISRRFDLEKHLVRINTEIGFAESPFERLVQSANVYSYVGPRNGSSDWLATRTVASMAAIELVSTNSNLDLSRTLRNERALRKVIKKDSQRELYSQRVFATAMHKKNGKDLLARQADTAGLSKAVQNSERRSCRVQVSPYGQEVTSAAGIHLGRVSAGVGSRAAATQIPQLS